MNSIVTQLLSFPPSYPVQYVDYDKLAKGNFKLLSNTGAAKLRDGVGGTNLFDVFDPAVNSMAYLFTLLAHVQNVNDLTPSSPLGQRAAFFLQTYDPEQIRYTGHEWKRLMEEFGRAAEKAGETHAAIEPLRISLLRLDPYTSTVTSCHIQFLRLCLLVRAFDAAASVLGNDAFHVPTTDRAVLRPLPCAPHSTSSTYITLESGLSTKLDYVDLLLYNLYGGMAFLGQKNWSRACRFFELVVTHPTHQAPSLIQVEAYKKWILANLLMSGIVPSAMPRGTSAQASKHYRALGKAYETLAEACTDPEPGKLKAEIDAGKAEWQADGNNGLVLQILGAQQRFAIHSLAKVYESLRLSVLATLPVLAGESPSDVEVYIRNLIDTGQLHATLKHASDPSSSILRFDRKSASSGVDEMQAEKQLLQARSRFEALDAHVQIMQRRTEMSKEYLEAERKVRRSKAEGADAPNGLGSSMHPQMMDFQDEEALEEI